jgi:hypothetical protein
MEKMKAAVDDRDGDELFAMTAQLRALEAAGIRRREAGKARQLCECREGQLRECREL